MTTYSITFDELLDNLNDTFEFGDITPYDILQSLNLNFDAIQENYSTDLFEIFTVYGLGDDFMDYYMGDLLDFNNNLCFDIFDYLQENNILLIDNSNNWDLDSLIDDLTKEYDRAEE